MNMVKTNLKENTDKKTLYRLTKGRGTRLNDAEDGIYAIDIYAIYEDDTDAGDTVERLAFVSGGTRYYTGSKSMIKTFKQIADVYGDESFSIELKHVTSKAGRVYLICDLV